MINNTQVRELTEERIAALFIGENISETVKDGTISVYRAPQTTTNKPYYAVFADCRPRVYGGHGAYSAKRAMSLVRYLRK